MAPTPRSIRPFRSRARALAFGLTLASAALLFAGVARAHGPTIEISHGEMKPALLNLFVGTTVHFLNTVAMPGGHVIVDTQDKLESPPLAKPGDGWHYTFDEVGTFEIFLRQHPKTRARINVVPKKAQP